MEARELNIIEPMVLEQPVEEPQFDPANIPVDVPELDIPSIPE